MRLFRGFHRIDVVVVAVLVAVAAAEARQAAPGREPASKAAAILTWAPEKRERYIAALDSFFLTRTVKASSRPHALDAGRPLAAFEAGGGRARDFEQFLAAQRVRGVLVLQDGKLRLERYVAPHGPTTRWNSFSIAKSITSTLVGAAIRDGAIKSLDDPVTRYIKGLRGSAYDDVTVRQLLTMTSGVKWNEDYTDVNSDVARMYAQAPDPGFDMTVSYVRKLPREAPAGAKWVYKTSETNLVGVLVAEATGKPLAQYLSEKIWRPYGMERDAEWMIDDVGHEQGGCCLGMTLRDYGRFGQFVLDGARIAGKDVVADGWLADATRSHVSTGGSGGYGYQWWTNADGTFEARGIYGQTLHIDRARRLVIVLNSATEQPTGRPAGQARQAFIAAVNAEVDAEKAGVAPAAVQTRKPETAPRLRILVVHGPNLNLLGRREPQIYGATTLDQINARLDELAKELDVELLTVQSNTEGVIVDTFQKHIDDVDGAVINAAGLTFSSVSIHDAIKAMPFPVIEVHISNLATRDEIHRHSILSSAARGSVMGLGWRSYTAALRALVESVREEKAAKR